METPFTIVFSFPLAHADYTMPLTARAQLHHSSPYYVVDSFHFSRPRDEGSSIAILPPIEIEFIAERDTGAWVHRDSHRVSLLSLAIGKAIENSGHFNYSP